MPAFFIGLSVGSPLRSYRMRREFTGQDAGMNIGASLAKTAQEGCAGIARWYDEYIAPVGVHITVDVLVGWPQDWRGRGRHPASQREPPNAGLCGR